MKFDNEFKNYMDDVTSYNQKVRRGRRVAAADPAHPRFSQAAEDKRQVKAVTVANKVDSPAPETDTVSGPEPESMSSASGRRFTTAELDAMEQTAVDQGMSPEAAADASASMAGGVEEGENFSGGFGASLQRTVLGLKQAWQYMAGDDAGREAINQAIQKLEEHPALQTPSGKLGEAAGTAAQFMGPQGMASGASKVLPLAVTKGARMLTREPGSVGRAAIQGGAYEATQPVSPSDADTEEYLQAKSLKAAEGVGGGAVTGKVGKLITSPGVPISPERKAIIAEADRLGIKLTPAQRTGDITLQQYEEGLASRPGSAKIINDARKAQQDVLDKKAAEAIGSQEAKPNETVLAIQRTIADQGYKPVASIPKMSWDANYITDLKNFAKKQAIKATGSKDAAGVANRLQKGTGKLTGNGFLEELQGIRNMAFEAKKNGQSATGDQLNDLASIMEDFAERKVAKLAKQGLLPADAMDQYRNARTEIAKIHAIEKATDPVKGKVSSLKYLDQERKRTPASKGPSQTPVGLGLADVGATARVLHQVTPYIGSSGTAERIAGQQLVEGSQGLFSALKASGPIAKNYLAGQVYMKYGGKPGPLGNRLTKSQNMFVKRLLPDATFAAEEGVND